MKKFLLLFVVFLFSVSSFSAAEPRSKDILFIGNSMTYFWGMPVILDRLGKAAEPKWDFNIDSLFEGGQSIGGFWEKGTIQKKLKDSKYDILVLQPYPKKGMKDDFEEHIALTAQRGQKAQSECQNHSLHVRVGSGTGA